MQIEGRIRASMEVYPLTQRLQVGVGQYFLPVVAGSRREDSKLQRLLEQKVFRAPARCETTCLDVCVDSDAHSEHRAIGDGPFWCLPLDYSTVSFKTNYPQREHATSQDPGCTGPNMRAFISASINPTVLTWPCSAPKRSCRSSSSKSRSGW